MSNLQLNLEDSLSLAAARHSLELDPHDEAAHRQVMRLLARRGDLVGALAQFEHCCRTLQAASGAHPAAETTALAAAIRAGETPPEPGANPPTNLPAALGPLIGREREMEDLARLLADPNCRLLTLVGPGGGGKTRLALQAAAGALPGFEGGVFVVNLEETG